MKCDELTSILLVLNPNITVHIDHPFARCRNCVVQVKKELCTSSAVVSVFPIEFITHISWCCDARVAMQNWRPVWIYAFIMRTSISLMNHCLACVHLHTPLKLSATNNTTKESFSWDLCHVVQQISILFSLFVNYLVSQSLFVLFIVENETVYCLLLHCCAIIACFVILFDQLNGIIAALYKQFRWI